MTTPFHSKYWAHELTLQAATGSIESISRSIAGARVDLNPHQVDAALFALRSPLTRGVLLADEVGLGKTIEAGIVIAQRWAERRRRILLIVPATLRKQWQQELESKFYLPTTILDSKVASDLVNAGNPDPLCLTDRLIVCSYHFASAKAQEISRILWDLVVIDEAHRLRNVYRKSSKLARNVVAAVEKAPKLLVTATPLQNSLMELYGLASVIDDHIFGDAASFRDQFVRAVDERLRNTELHGFAKSARRISVNSKGEALIPALKVAFERAELLGAERKAVIFTESRRTQQYLFDLLSDKGYKDQVVMMNRSNNDPHSSANYRLWRECDAGQETVTGSRPVDIKAAIVEHFRDHATVLVATEAAAEGVNLQFCSLVVNYDLPWNPQRIEQRIGRCHRYGQKHDVVVINFLNRRNEADQRVPELLSEKFKLFDGVFGASDAVKLEAQMTLKSLEVERNRKRRELFDSQDAIDGQRDELIKHIEGQLRQRHAVTPVFCFRWRLV